jgi:hypothetical protein
MWIIRQATRHFERFASGQSRPLIISGWHERGDGKQSKRNADVGSPSYHHCDFILGRQQIGPAPMEAT